jgi:endonuclease YncB( thermonuclease family)
MPLAAALFCLVVGISDGDTLTLRCDDATVKVRLAEVDAPEHGQPWGDRSRQALASLCFQQRAELRKQDVDRYGRTVGRVACGGRDASQEQVDAGMAWAYIRHLTDPAIASGERAARAERRGLWQDTNPIAPWLWRQAKRTDAP